jgi:DNA repair protein RadC
VLVREGTVPTAWDRQVRASRDVATLMRPLVAGLDREQFWVLLLNGKNRAIGINLVSVGALTTTLVHPRLCFAKHKRGYVAAALMWRRAWFSLVP